MVLPAITVPTILAVCVSASIFKEETWEFSIVDIRVVHEFSKKSLKLIIFFGEIRITIRQLKRLILRNHLEGVYAKWKS